MIMRVHNEAEILFDIALQNGLLEECYVVASKRQHGIPWEEIELSDKLIDFKDFLPSKNQKQVIQLFLKLLREELKIVDVDVVSAVPLTTPQLITIERKLIQTVHKRVGINSIVDKSLIGGLKIIIGNTVINNSIKSQLMALKDELYKGVYFKFQN